MKLIEKVARIRAITFIPVKRYLKREDTNISYEGPKPQGAKRRPDAKKGGAKPPHPVNPCQPLPTFLITVPWWVN